MNALYDFHIVKMYSRYCPKEVKKLIERIKEQGLSLQPSIDFKVDSNEGIEHQYGNTECGIYSIFFIVHMLEDRKSVV